MSTPRMPTLFNEFQHPKRTFLAAYVRSGNISRASRAARVNLCMHYYWKKTDPRYAAAFEEAKEMAAQHLEDEAVRRALGGSDVLLIFLLKGFMPEKYKDRHVVEHQGAVELLHKLARLPQMSDQELDDLAAEVAEYARRRASLP